MDLDPDEVFRDDEDDPENEFFKVSPLNLFCLFF